MSETECVYRHGLICTYRNTNCIYRQESKCTDPERKLRPIRTGQDCQLSTSDDKTIRRNWKQQTLIWLLFWVLIFSLGCLGFGLRYSSTIGFWNDTQKTVRYLGPLASLATLLLSGWLISIYVNPKTRLAIDICVAIFMVETFVWIYLMVGLFYIGVW